MKFTETLAICSLHGWDQFHEKTFICILYNYRDMNLQTYVAKWGSCDFCFNGLVHKFNLTFLKNTPGQDFKFYIFLMVWISTYRKWVNFAWAIFLELLFYASYTVNEDKMPVHGCMQNKYKLVWVFMPLQEHNKS